MSTVTTTLAEFEATLPPAPEPVGSYVPAVWVGQLIYTSGVLPMKEGKLQYQGAIGAIPMRTEDGYEAARLCCINALSILKGMLGSLDRIERIIKLTGYVHSKLDFKEQPQVINGASNLLVELFGDAGRHARAAVGVASLPLGASVELDLIVQVK